MFNNLIGNDKIKNDLQTVLKNNNIFHSYMFIGTEGIGKKEFAKEFANGILCTGEIKPCGKCKSCLEFQSNNHPDFYYIGLGEENSIKIEVIRQLQKKIGELPIVSNRKVYIIDDFEYVTKEAQNCLLKTIEEPPEFVTIILITANESRILNTIKSRCLKISFNNIEDDLLKKFLEENYYIKNISKNKLKSYNGSIGKALQMQEKEEIYTKVEKVFENIDSYNIISAKNNLEVLYKEKDYITEILDYINVVFLNKATNNAKYIDYIEKVEETKRKINSNCNYDMTIDSLLFKIFELE